MDCIEAYFSMQMVDESVRQLLASFLVEEYLRLNN